MKMTERLKFVRQRVKDQREWIDRHGGDLAGYIRYYGDPGIAPCDKNGNAETITCPDDLAQECGLRPVPNATGCYYKQHFGSGGTLIFQADIDCLLRYERELVELEPRYGTWLREAEQREKDMDTPQVFKGRSGDMTAEDLLADIEATVAAYLNNEDANLTRDASKAARASRLYEALVHVRSRTRLGRRVLGQASPSMADDENMLNRPWS